MCWLNWREVSAWVPDLNGHLALPPLFPQFVSQHWSIPPPQLLFLAHKNGLLGGQATRPPRALPHFQSSRTSPLPHRIWLFFNVLSAQSPEKGVSNIMVGRWVGRFGLGLRVRLYLEALRLCRSVLRSVGLKVGLKVGRS